MKKEDKNAIIEQLAATVKEFNHFYLTDLFSLDAEKTSELRALCFKNEVKLVMVKNSLLRKALESLGEDYSAFFECLTGTTAVMFSNTGNAPAKILKKYKEGNPTLKAAYVEESFYVGAEHLDTLVHIKSKNELIGDVIGLLQSPAKNVISGLQSAGNTIHGVLQTLAERES